MADTVLGEGTSRGGAYQVVLFDHGPDRGYTVRVTHRTRGQVAASICYLPTEALASFRRLAMEYGAVIKEAPRERLFK